MFSSCEKRWPSLSRLKEAARRSTADPPAPRRGERGDVEVELGEAYATSNPLGAVTATDNPLAAPGRADGTPRAAARPADAKRTPPKAPRHPPAVSGIFESY